MALYSNTFIHGQKSMQMRCRLLVVFLLKGSFDAVTAQFEIDEIIDPLLAFGDPTLGQVQLLDFDGNAFCQVGREAD